MPSCLPACAGVGKTTTARIIARGLNCIGPDGKRTEPTIDPCGVCEPCVAIAESRHVDVQEMDAATRTGIDDIREIIEGVRYAPASARYKVYIIDEVHMLSKQAFNGLLKTLEEPPPHVKFIFATTEIRKVPVTVLSRCQRFDLRRVEADVLIAHLADIAKKENVEIEELALASIARAAEGSVRDAQSLFDQAIAHAASEGQGKITAESVRAMLGLADRGRILDLFEQVMGGKIAEALGELKELYDRGADPLAVMQDLLETTHFLTRVKVAPAAEGFFEGGSAEAARAGQMAAKLSVPSLTRAWQMLLRSLLEVRDAGNPIAAAEMALIRLGPCRRFAAHRQIGARAARCRGRATRATRTLNAIGRRHAHAVWAANGSHDGGDARAGNCAPRRPARSAECRAQFSGRYCRACGRARRRCAQGQSGKRRASGFSWNAAA